MWKYILCTIYFIGSTNTYYYGHYHLPLTSSAYPWGYGNIKSQGPNGIPRRYRPEVKLYYESMCPDCRNFDTTVFSRMLSLLGPYLDIFTYPYGKATTYQNADGSLSFVCQHGPHECYGNKLHACALQQMGQDQALMFNACMMRPERPYNGSNDASADECGAIMGIDASAIKQCARSGQGDVLLKYCGEQTKMVDLRFVPHVVINGKHWDGQNEGFIKDVCAAFTNPPAACRLIY